MSFRLSEIRKTKRASHWSKRGPYTNSMKPMEYQNSANLSLPSLLHDPAFILPQLNDQSRSGEQFSLPIGSSSISPTNSK